MPNRKKKNLPNDNEEFFHYSEDIGEDSISSELDNLNWDEKKLDKKFDLENELFDKKFREKKKRKKEDSSTVEGVLDLSTSKEIFKLQSNGFLKGLGGIISTGKEANVYHGYSNNLDSTKNIDHLAIKVFKTRTLDFKKIKTYIEGDIRFKKSGKKHHQIIQTWALKEYKNLTRAYENNVSVPQPFYVRRNILVMEFIGNDGLAAPQLRNCKNFESEELIINIYNQVIHQIELLWKEAKLVHADLSAYNILLQKEKIYIIDMGQAVLTNHNLAESFLYRDINNIMTYFDTFDIKIDNSESEKIFEKITGKIPDTEFLKLL